MTISSSGNLEILGGQVERQKINLSSSGEHRARDLPSAQAEQEITPWVQLSKASCVL